MDTLPGNAVLVQSGGPTAVINSSACGIIEEARQQTHSIGGLFGTERVLDDVRDVHRRLGRCFVVVSEGVQDKTGTYIAAQTSVDPFGRRQLGGAADYLRHMVLQELGLKARYNKLDTCQRNAIHFASRTDSDEAYLCGQEAVRHALAGASGVMVSLARKTSKQYQSALRLVPLGEVASGVKALPRDFMDEAGTHISEAMREYATPLLRGEVPIRIGPDGLPMFAHLQRKPVPRKLPPFVGKH